MDFGGFPLFNSAMPEINLFQQTLDHYKKTIFTKQLNKYSNEPQADKIPPLQFNDLVRLHLSDYIKNVNFQNEPPKPEKDCEKILYRQYLAAAVVMLYNFRSYLAS